MGHVSSREDCLLYCGSDICACEFPSVPDLIWAFNLPAVRTPSLWLEWVVLLRPTYCVSPGALLDAHRFIFYRVVQSISKLCWKCVNEGDLCEKQKHPFNSAVTLEFWSWRAAAPWTSSQTSSSTLLRLLGLSLQAWDLVFSNLNRRMLCPELQSKAQTPVAPVSPSTRPPWGFVYDFQPVCGMPLVFKCALEDSAANLLPSSQRRIFLIGLCVWVSGFFIINLCLKAYMLNCKSVILWFL